MMTDKEAAKLLHETLAHAVAGNESEAATGLQILGSQSDANRMYGVCWGLAESGRLMLNRLYGDKAPKGPDEMWIVQQLNPGAFEADPPHAFATRFIIAHANGDTDTTLALYGAALNSEGDQYIDSVCALLAEVAGLCRLALDKTSDSEERKKE